MQARLLRHDSHTTMSADLNGGFVVRAPDIEAFACPVGQKRCKHVGIACIETMPHDRKRIERSTLGASLEVGFVAPHLANRLTEVEVELAPADIGLEVDDLLREAIHLVRLEILPREKNASQCAAG